MNLLLVFTQNDTQLCCGFMKVLKNSNFYNFEWLRRPHQMSWYSGFECTNTWVWSTCVWSLGSNTKIVWPSVIKGDRTFRRRQFATANLPPPICRQPVCHLDNLPPNNLADRPIGHRDFLFLRLKKSSSMSKMKVVSWKLRNYFDKK